MYSYSYRHSSPFVINYMPTPRHALPWYTQCVISAFRVAIFVVTQAFYEGFMDAMKRYRTELELKVGVDRTQMTYHCCGALSYEDWFEVSWVDVEFVDKFDSEVGK